MKREKIKCKCGEFMKQMGGPKLRKKSDSYVTYFKCKCGRSLQQSVPACQAGVTYTITLSDDTGRLKKFMDKALLEFYKDIKGWTSDYTSLKHVPRVRDWSVLDHIPEDCRDVIPQILMYLTHDAYEAGFIWELLYRAAANAKIRVAKTDLD